MTTPSISELQDVQANADLVFSTHQINAAVESMANALSSKIENQNAIMLCVMNGGLVITSDILRALQCEVRLDYLQVARYRDKTVGGSLHWHKEPQLSLEGQVVVLVDDIYDEGYTLEEVVSYCRRMGAKEVITAVLLLKEKKERKVSMQPDIYGLDVNDRYVFGYGMDYKGYLRNLPAIYAVKNEE